MSDPKASGSLYARKLKDADWKRREIVRLQELRLHDSIKDWRFIVTKDARYLNVQGDYYGVPFDYWAKVLSPDNTTYVLMRIAMVLRADRWGEHLSQIRAAKSYIDLPVTNEDDVLLDWKQPPPAVFI